MPLVTSPPIGQQNGDVVTQFTDTTSTTSVTYTYPTQQTSLIIENSGEQDILVTVAGFVDQVVQANKKWRVDVPFTSFSIRSNVNSQEFIATVISNIADMSYFDLAYIKNRRLVCNDTKPASTAKYTGIDVGTGNLPTSMKCKAIFENATGDTTIALISNPNGLQTVSDITTKSLHIIYNYLNVTIQLWDAGSLTTLSTKTYSTPCKKDGVSEYSFEWSVSGNDLTVTVNGQSWVVTDTRIPANMGRYCTLEHYYNGSGPTLARPQFTYFEVSGTGFNSLKDNFKRNNGAIGIAPTGHVYVQITNT